MHFLYNEFINFVSISTLKVKKFTLIAFLSIWATLLIPVTAQEDTDAHTPCATSSEYPVWLANYLDNPNRPKARNLNGPVYLPITFHTVGTDQGEGHYSTIKIMESLCRLNSDFEPYNIQFYLKEEINQINRSNYYEHDNFNDGRRMMQSFKKPLSINAFITESAPSGACGYYHPSADGVVVIKSCMGGSGHTLTHEVGHWLSLPHTFAGWEGKDFDATNATPEFLSISGRDTVFVEKVSGENCSKAGDRFCDTSPDYLSDGWNCNGEFLSVKVQVDPNGEDFRSNGKNFMSYSVDACQSEFSKMQVDAMHAYVEFAKSFYVSEFPQYQPVSKEPMNLVYPEEDEKVGHKKVRLEWEHQTNATHYIVNLSRFFFATIDYEYIVEGNSVVIDELPVDKTWYWRVKPYNQNDVCADFTEGGAFVTYDVTDVEEISEDNHIDIYPTLVNRDNPVVHVDFQFNDILETQVQIFSAAGNMVLDQRFRNPGNQMQDLQVGHLTSGMYFMRISTPQGQIVRRIAIQ